MPINRWIEHVRAYAKENNISYSCAVTEAKASYVKAPPAPRKPRTPKQQKSTEPKKDNKKPPEPSSKPPEPSSKPTQSSVGGGGLKKSIGDREKDKTNRIYVKIYGIKGGVTVMFFYKYKIQAQKGIFIKKVERQIDGRDINKKDFTRSQLIQMFKEWYDKNKIAPDTGNNILRKYREIPFNDLIFEF